MRRLRWLLALVLLVPAALGGGAALLNYTGYCVAQRRYLTDEELIKKTVDVVLANYPRITYAYDVVPKVGYEVVTDRARCCGEGDRSRFDGSKGGTPLNAEQLVPYQGTDEFFKVNPDCCVFARDGLYGELGSTSLWSKITGYSAGFASAKFRVRYQDTAGQVQEKYSGWSANYSNCGKPVNTVFD
jgi:hypothetical protein